MFCITPETFDAFDVGLSLGNSFSFIDNQMNPTPVQSSISMPVIGVVKDVRRIMLDDQRRDLSSDSRGSRKVYHQTVSLVNAKNDSLSGSSPANCEETIESGILNRPVVQWPTPIFLCSNFSGTYLS